MEEINLKDFFEYYKKYLLYVVIAVFVCVFLMVGYNLWIKKPMYSTSTTIVLVKNEDINDKSDTISQNDILLNQKLVATYSQIIKSKLVLNQVIDALKLNYSYEKLYNEIDVKAVDETEILRITVTDSVPSRAALIANITADVFTAEVIKIYNINNVSIIDKAEVINDPSNNNMLRDIVLGMMVGFVLASAVIFIVYYFDDTLRDTDYIEKEIKMPVIAKVFKDHNDAELIVEKKPKASTSESIRTLRTNLQFASVDEDIKTILVTSSLPGEGKSFISANLATAFAGAGKKVLLVDCDLRKGRQHKIFKLNGKNGLSNLLVTSLTKTNSFINETRIEGLSVITRGIVPPNPSELLNSKKNKDLIERLKKEFDVIILDGAPIVGLSDSLILSSIVDKVLLVTSVGHTPKTELINSKKALENVGADIAGCVANNINVKSHSYGNYYYYNDYYYYSDKGTRK